jgi:hypothetical protein
MDSGQKNRSKFRYLRLGLIAGATTVLILLIAIWMVSYSKVDFAWIQFSPTRTISVISCKGYVSFGTPPIKYYRDKGSLGYWDHYRYVANEFSLLAGNTQSHLGVYWTSTQPAPRGLQVIVPYWMLTLFVGALNFTLLWKRQWRFSLRTLLIATTVVALALGVIVLSL